MLFADPGVPQTVFVEAAKLVLVVRIDIALIVVVLLEAAVCEDEVNAQATDAEPSVVSSLEPFNHVHLSPPWTVSGIVTIMASVEVASVLARLLQLLADPAVHVGPPIGVKRELLGGLAVGSPAFVEVVRGGAESPSPSTDLSPALIPRDCGMSLRR